MRIIHTADWHLCDRLGRIDRTADLRTRVERVAELCHEYSADLLLVAGDLFRKEAAVEEMTSALRHLRGTFAQFLERGGTILAITGNHDRDDRVDLLRAGMSLVASPPPPGGRLAPGRFYLVNGCYFGVLEPRPGDAVQFVLVPYPVPSRYELPTEEYRTLEEQNRLLHGRVAEWVQGVTRRPGFDPALPTVLAAHLHVRGSEVHSLYRLTERDDVLFDLADLNPAWAYVALGHIHKPQAVNGVPNVRYSGSLDRLHFDETHDDHGVLLVEVGRHGLTSDPERLPIRATPFHVVPLTDPAAELPGLAARYPDRETALVRVTIAPFASGPSRDEITRELRRLFPRLYAIDWPATSDDRDNASARFNLRAGLATTVRDYLGGRLAGDPDREAILTLAEGFLAKEGES